jgi:hypothetical protein
MKDRVVDLFVAADLGGCLNPSVMRWLLDKAMMVPYTKFINDEDKRAKPGMPTMTETLEWYAAEVLFSYIITLSHSGIHLMCQCATCCR